MGARLTFGLILLAAVTLVLGFASRTAWLIYVSIGCSAIAAVGLLTSSRRKRERAEVEENMAWTASLAEPADAGGYPILPPSADPTPGGEAEADAEPEPAWPRPVRLADPGRGAEAVATVPLSRRRTVPAATAEPEVDRLQDRPRSPKRIPFASDLVRDAQSRRGGAAAAGAPAAAGAARGTGAAAAAGAPAAAGAARGTGAAAAAGAARGTGAASRPAAPAPAAPGPGSARTAAVAVAAEQPAVARRAATVAASPPPGPASVPRAAAGPSRAALPVDARQPASQPRRTPAYTGGPMPASPARRRVGQSPVRDHPLAIDGYEHLGVPEILPLLPELDDQELVDILVAELEGANRIAIINRIDALLEGEG